MPGKFDFVEQFGFYGSYHTNKVNVLIHVFCVPTILFTGLVLSHAFSPMRLSLASLTLPPALGGGDLDLTFPVLYVAATALYYITLEAVAGLLYAPLLLAMGHMSNVVYANDPDLAIKYAGWAFGAAWIAQFIGHGKFEGRAPALLDSLFQSLVLAVFFVFLEVLFMLGYKPALHRKLQNKTGVVSAASLMFRAKTCTDYSVSRGQLVAQFRKERAAKAKAR